MRARTYGEVVERVEGVEEGLEESVENNRDDVLVIGM